VERDPDVIRFEGSDGVQIVADRHGDPVAPAVVFLHGGGQTRHSWGGAAASVARRGWQGVTLDLRGHGESGWPADGSYRVVSFAHDLREVLRQLPAQPVLVGASLGGFTSMLLAGEVEPGIARAVVLVDVVPDLEESGTMRVHTFMTDRSETGFESLEEVADVIAAYNPNRPRPVDLDGLRKNLRERDGRWYWHWDPRFMSGTAEQVPVEVTEVDRLHRAVDRMLADDVPMLLVRGRVSDLVSQEKADAFRARFPAVDYVDVSGAGHMVAGDRNDVFTNAIVEFLSRHESG
jgi:peroxiredoxin